jgi:hypothetical protein
MAHLEHQSALPTQPLPPSLNLTVLLTQASLRFLEYSMDREFVYRETEYGRTCHLRVPARRRGCQKRHALVSRFRVVLRDIVGITVITLASGPTTRGVDVDGKPSNGANSVGTRD